jgi:predicted N-formylglutamate amidohydrolase
MNAQSAASYVRTTMQTLLASDEPNPVMIGHAESASPFFLACDHASNRIPRSLNSLGLPEHELARHIGWDIGIWEVSRQVADALDAPLVGQAYSRLVIDCNRPVSNPSSIPEISEATVIPGNIGLDDVRREARVREVFRPYHHHLTEALNARGGRPTALIAMHSFTPIYSSVARQWHAGVLFNRDLGLSRIMLELLNAEPGLCIGENEPYTVSEISDYTAPVHAEARNLPYLELEIRQDLIETADGQREWAERMIRLLPLAWDRYVNRRQ